MKTLKRLLPLAALLFTAAVGLSDALTALQNRFDGGAVFRADLEHRYVDAFTGDTTLTFGRIWMARDGYKVETSDQTLVVRNGISRVFNKYQKKLIISSYSPEEDDFAPSRFFTPDRSGYTATDSKVGNETRIRLVFSDPYDLLKNATVTVGSNGMPLRVDAEDQAGNLMRSAFTYGRFLSDTTGVFRLSVPSGTEVIDLREN